MENTTHVNFDSILKNPGEFTENSLLLKCLQDALGKQQKPVEITTKEHNLKTSINK